MQQPKAFTRQMGVFDILLLTLSLVTPAASVYVIIPGIIQQAGAGALLSLVLAAFVALAMSFVYAELASAHPIAGGEYSLFGRTLGPLVGFAYMGTNVVQCTLGPAVLALGAGAYVGAVWKDAPAAPIAVGILAFSTVLGLLNIRFNALVTGLFLAVELLVLAALAALGIFHPARGPEFLIHPIALTPAKTLTEATPAMIGLATAAAIFAYNGFGAAVYFSEEMVGARRGVARAILLCLFLAVATEFIPTAAVFLGAPDLGRLIASPTPFGDFVLTRGGRLFADLVSLGVALAIVNALIAQMLANARFFFASGRDAAWTAPVNRAFVWIHPRFGSPWPSTLVAGALSIVGCLLPFQLVLVMTSAAIVVMYVLLCLAAIVGRLNGTTAHGLYKMPLFPLAPALGLAALAYVLYANWLDPTVGRPSLIATAAVAAAAIVYAVCLRMGRGPALAVVGPADEG